MALKALGCWFYGNQLEKKYLRLTGEAFEDFFCDVMQKKYKADFSRVRAYGNVGDKKCDGYLASQKTVHQCYAPRQTKSAAMSKKIDDDFPGAKSHWKDKMLRWRFVHNDLEGLPVDIVQKLLDLNESEVHVQIDEFNFAEMRDLVLLLPLHDLEDLLGFAPTEVALDGLDFAQLRPVVEYIAKEEPPELPPIDAPSPQKLDANDFSSDVRGMLEVGRTRIGLVRDYFQKHSDPFLGEEIAQGFRERYSDLKKEGLSANQIYSELHQFAGGAGGSIERSSAVLAILTYFFESCDIFENVQVDAVVSAQP